MVGYVQYTLELLPEELPADKQYYLQLTYFGDEPNGYGDFGSLSMVRIWLIKVVLVVWHVWTLHNVTMQYLVL